MRLIATLLFAIFLMPTSAFADKGASCVTLTPSTPEKAFAAVEELAYIDSVVLHLRALRRPTDAGKLSFQDAFDAMSCALTTSFGVRPGTRFGDLAIATARRQLFADGGAMLFGALHDPFVWQVVHEVASSWASELELFKVYPQLLLDFDYALLKQAFDSDRLVARTSFFIEHYEMHGASSEEIADATLALELLVELYEFERGRGDELAFSMIELTRTIVAAVTEISEH